MLSSLLTAYFLHQFSLPVIPPQRGNEAERYMQSVRPRGHLTVEAQSAGTASVPPGSQRVSMLRLHLSADCSGDVIVNSIRLQRRGLGFHRDIETVYAVHKGGRISRARTISNGDGTFNLNVRGFTVPACSAQDVSILADFAAEASRAGEHRLALLDMETSGSTVRIASRVAGPEKTKTAVGPPVGAISVDYLPLNRTVRYGFRRMVQRFTLEADSISDHLIHAVTFTNLGSASDADLQNLYLDFRNRPVSVKVSQMDGDSVRLEFDPPFLLSKNSKLKFGLRADVRAGRTKTIRFVIEEEADVEAVPD